MWDVRRIEIAPWKVRYCRSSIGKRCRHFRFHHADVFNKYYNPGVLAVIAPALTRTTGLAKEVPAGFAAYDSRCHDVAANSSSRSPTQMRRLL